MQGCRSRGGFGVARGVAFGQLPEGRGAEQHNIRLQQQPAALDMAALARRPARFTRAMLRHGLDYVLTRLTVIGAAYLSIICVLPEILISQYSVPFYFGGTSLLIIVVVTMDFMAQVQSYMMQQQYDSLLKKANFKMGNS